MDWYPWYPTLYKADTLNLTLEQDGAYRRLIDHYMESRAPLPDDEVSLARIVGIDIKHFQAIAEPLLGKFRAKAGLLHHKRCDIELNRQDKLSKKMSGIAKAAAQKRKENNPIQAKAGLKPSQSRHTRQDKTVKDKEEAKASKKKKTPQELSPNPDCRGELVLRNTDILESVDLWNLMAEKTKLPKVQMLTAVRKKKLKARLAEIGGLPGWRQALVMVAESKFLVGDNDSGWTASFDFLLQPSSMTKLMEGNYTNREVPNHPGDPNSIEAHTARGNAAVERLRKQIEKENINAH